MFFDLDYSAYVIEHFPYMEIENSRLADRFAYTVDWAYERGTDLGLSDVSLGLKSPTLLMSGW
jgi:predicted ATPase